MARLEELINSLATVLVSYHDSQKNNIPSDKPFTLFITESDPERIKARSYAITQIVQKKDFEKKLNELITECTGHDPLRLPFLTFLKDEILVLKKQLAKETPFTNEEFDKYKNKISNLLIDLKKLLTIAKTKSSPVKIDMLDDTPIISKTMNGLNDPGLVTTALCRSGTLIKVEVLDRLNIKEATSDQEIREIAGHLCETHQNALLLVTLQAQQTEHEKTKLQLEESAKTIKELRAELEKTTLKLKEILEKNETLDLTHKLAPYIAGITLCRFFTNPQLASRIPVFDVENDSTSIRFS